MKNFCFLIVVGLVLSGAVTTFGQPLDLSDSSVQQFLDRPFQFDYTTIRDDSTLRNLVNAIDYQLAMIDCRQLMEYLPPLSDSSMKQPFRPELENRYRELMRDGFMFEVLGQWQKTTKSAVNQAFIDLLMSQHEGLQIDPTALSQAKELARRIANRLYSFHFSLDGRFFSAADAVRIIESDTAVDLAKKLYRLQNDSAAMLASDANRLYSLYNVMGQLRGFPTSFDGNIVPYSYSKSEWTKIVEELKTITDSEYQCCLQVLSEECGRSSLKLFEVERLLRDKAVLDDKYFTADKIDLAVHRIVDSLGLSSLWPRLTIDSVETGPWPALAVRLDPPYSNHLIKAGQSGFSYYCSWVREVGRAVPWVFSDSTLPYSLRTYPSGTEEMLSSFFEGEALDRNLLSKNFSIPDEELDRFETYYRWQTLLEIRKTVAYFLLDYHLSEGVGTDPTAEFWSLEHSLLGVSDSSYQWIEVLINGRLQRYPEWLADVFSRIKLEEMLYQCFGEGYLSNPKCGGFLIDRFCRPGKSQSMKQFISANCRSDLSVADLKRQLKLK